jgi:hypothetical protein
VVNKKDIQWWGIISLFFGLIILIILLNSLYVYFYNISLGDEGWGIIYIGLLSCIIAIISALIQINKKTTIASTLGLTFAILFLSGSSWFIIIPLLLVLIAIIVFIQIKKRKR